MVADEVVAHDMNPFADYVRRLTALIRHPGVPIPDPLFDDLARHLFRLQFRHVTPYSAFAGARGQTPDRVTRWRDIPAVPTTAFKELDWTSLPLNERESVFHSSGTTAQQPSRHFHNQESLALYEASVRPWFRHHLLPEAGPGPFLLALTPEPALAPRSSLVHMLDTVRCAGMGCGFEYAGAIDAQGEWTVDWESVERCLLRSSRGSHPIALLGTALGFVALLDRLVDRAVSLDLPAGSRVMETGGYKGRTRALAKATLHHWIQERLGIPPSCIVSEYGMTELSSQAYDHIAGQPPPSGPRRFRFPPWARALVVSPETGLEAGVGETGLLRIVDLANVRSAAVIQTEDLAVSHVDGFELVGRLSGSEPRGCSLLQLPVLA